MMCKKNKWCSFESVEDSTHKVERCIYCGRKVIYRYVNKRVNNVKYLKDHVRDFCQPYGPTGKIYMQIYGKDTLKKAEADLKAMVRSKERQANFKQYATEELMRAYQDTRIFI